jgi:hypothetical protein
MPTAAVYRNSYLTVLVIAIVTVKIFIGFGDKGMAMTERLFPDPLT